MRTGFWAAADNSPSSRSKRNKTPRAYDFRSGLTVLEDRKKGGEIKTNGPFN